MLSKLKNKKIYFRIFLCLVFLFIISIISGIYDITPFGKKFFIQAESEQLIISGYVKGDDGTGNQIPISGAIVETVGFSTTTDASGYYSLGPLPIFGDPIGDRNLYTLLVYKENYTPGWQSYDPRTRGGDLNPTDIDIGLQIMRKNPIKGIVYKNEWQAGVGYVRTGIVEGAIIEVMEIPIDGDSAPYPISSFYKNIRATSNASGEYSLEIPFALGFFGGPIKIRASHSNLSTDLIPFKGSNLTTGTITIDFDLMDKQPMRSYVKGQVSDSVSGQPVKGAIVYAGEFITNSDASGNYQFYDLPDPDSRVVTFSGAYYKTQSIDIAGCVDVCTRNVVLERLDGFGAIKGTVTFEEFQPSPLPVNNVDISLTIDNGRWIGSYQDQDTLNLRIIQTSEDGEYLFENIPVSVDNGLPDMSGFGCGTYRIKKYYINGKEFIESDPAACNIFNIPVEISSETIVDVVLGSAVAPNTSPSSRLTATGSSVQGDVLASGSTVTYNVKQGETITFAGMAWDCDGTVSELTDAKSERTHNLGAVTWSGPTLDETSPPILDCASERNYYGIGNQITISSSGDYFISITDDAGATSTSTIQVIVQAANAPPYIPQKISPSTGAGSQESSVTLTWSERSPRDPNGDTDFRRYEIWYVEPGQDPVIQANWKKYASCSNLPAGTTSCDLSGLALGNKIYYWNVIAIDKQEVLSHNPWCGNPANCQN